MRSDGARERMRIRELAARFGLSRATLLYYNRIGLLRPVARTPSGYRLYDAGSEDTLRRIVAFRSAGLSMAAIKTVLATKTTSRDQVLLARIEQIDGDINRLRAQQRMLVDMLSSNRSRVPSPMDKDAWIALLRAAGMSAADMQRWHLAFEQRAPKSHRDFLLWLGIPRDQVEQIQARSR
jgi:MerR family transcriptional regulator, thiopeptide resistance regulator